MRDGTGSLLLSFLFFLFLPDLQHGALLRDEAQVFINNDVGSSDLFNEYLLMGHRPGPRPPTTVESFPSPVLSNLILATTLTCKNYRTHYITKETEA